MKTAIILNPKSAGGKSTLELNQLKSKISSSFSNSEIIETTPEPGSATVLTRRAIKSGNKKIIAVGGDGTLSEVVNGLFQNGTLIESDVVFSFVMRGRGNDFRRTFGVPDDLDEAIAMASRGVVKKIDVGLVQYTDHNEKPAERYFLNVASLGMSGNVDEKVNQSPFSNLLGGKGVFYLSLLQTMVSYKSPLVTLQIDEHFHESLPINTVAIANGKYFGGGMKIAPEADVYDGLFDVVITGDLSPLEIVMNSPGLYSGTHVSGPKVKVLRGRQITATSQETVLLDIDGEAPGKLPAKFSILPSALGIQI